MLSWLSYSTSEGRHWQANVVDFLIRSSKKRRRRRRKKRNNFPHFWIGPNDIKQEDKFVNVDGSYLKTNWKNG